MSKSKSATIYTDGASRGNPGESGIGIVLVDEDGKKNNIKEYIGIGTNNQAEYKALIRGIVEAKSLKKNNLKIFSDSQLVVNQIKGQWKVKDASLKELFSHAKELLRHFQNVEITHIARENNKEADKLANEAINEYFNTK